jgi:hypothetical protein
MTDDRVVIGDEHFYPTKVKPNINSVEVQPELNNNGHPTEWCVGGCWFTMVKVGLWILVTLHNKIKKGNTDSIHILKLNKAYGQQNSQNKRLTQQVFPTTLMK